MRISMSARALARRLSIQMCFPYVQACSGKVCHRGQTFLLQSDVSGSIFLFAQIELCQMEGTFVPQINGPELLLGVANCFALRFSRKAKLGQKVVRFDPTMVSLPLDARRTKRPWSFERVACLTLHFAPVRRLSCETRCRRRRAQEQHFSPDCQIWSRSTPIDPNEFPVGEGGVYKSLSSSSTSFELFLLVMPS